MLTCKKSDRNFSLCDVQALGTAQSTVDCLSAEYSASEIRILLQELFPQRRLVLSQFTFFNQIGVAKPTGTTFRRRRRCYRLLDVLSIACVLQLKEEGIPLKNIEPVPGLVQENASMIFARGAGSRLSGCGSAVSLQLAGMEADSSALDALLANERPVGLFWGFDVGRLAERLLAVAQNAAPLLASESESDRAESRTSVTKLRRVA